MLPMPESLIPSRFRWLITLSLLLITLPALLQAGHLLTYPDFAARQSESWQLVDVRSETAFRAQHAPGSRRIPCYQIPVLLKHFTRQPLLLIGNAADQAVLIQRAEAFEKRGFSEVRVLSGGIAAWPVAEREGEQPEAIPTLAPNEAVALLSQPRFHLLFGDAIPDDLSEELGSKAGTAVLPSSLAPETVLIVQLNADPVEPAFRIARFEEEVALAYQAGNWTRLQEALRTRNAATRSRSVTTIQGGQASSFYTGQAASRASCCD